MEQPSALPEATGPPPVPDRRPPDPSLTPTLASASDPEYPSLPESQLDPVTGSSAPSQQDSTSSPLGESPSTANASILSSPAPRSKAFDDEGDAAMNDRLGKLDAAQTPFNSALQAAAKAAASSPPVTPKPTPTPDPKPKKLTQRTRLDRPPMSGDDVRRDAAQREGTPTRFTPSKGPAVWPKAGAAQVRAILSGTQRSPANPAGRRPVQSTAPALLEDLECARKAANLRRYGDQRCMTKHEASVLFKVLSQQLELEHLPSFLLETHTSAERDVLADFHRDHLGWRLYMVLPPGVAFPDVNPKYNLIHTLLLSCEDAAANNDVTALFSDAHTVTCDPKSQIVVLRFVHRETRDHWMDRPFRFRKETVVLQATDSLTTAVPRAGFDVSARQLLYYHVYLRGHQHLRFSDIRAIAHEAAQAPVLHVELIESVGLKDFSAPRWKLTFDQITCPEALTQVRRLHVNHNGTLLKIDVHHPRISKRVPCTKCLSVRHLARDCKNIHAARSLDRHTKTPTLTTGPGLPKLTAAKTPKILAQQLQQLCQIACPSLEARLHEEELTSLKSIELAAKARADRASQAAAAEARAIREAKKQVATDLSRRQKERGRAAYRLVTNELRQFHGRARRATQEIPTGLPTRQPTPPQATQKQHDGQDCQHVTETTPARDPEDQAPGTQHSSTPQDTAEPTKPEGGNECDPAAAADLDTAGQPYEQQLQTVTRSGKRTPPLTLQ